MHGTEQSDVDASTAPPSRRVVGAVAEAEGVEPTELEPPLFDAIDPDALDRLFTADFDDPSPADQVTFSYCGYEVTVHATGTVDLG